MKNEMVREICAKQGARIHRITEAFGKRKDLLVIENVPLVTCPQCGESYFTADTLHEPGQQMSPGRAKNQQLGFARPEPVPYLQAASKASTATLDS